MIKSPSAPRKAMKKSELRDAVDAPVSFTLSGDSTLRDVAIRRPGKMNTLLNI